MASQACGARPFPLAGSSALTNTLLVDATGERGRGEGTRGTAGARVAGPCVADCSECVCVCASSSPVLGGSQAKAPLFELFIISAGSLDAAQLSSASHALEGHAAHLDPLLCHCSTTCAPVPLIRVDRPPPQRRLGARDQGDARRTHQVRPAIFHARAELTDRSREGKQPASAHPRRQAHDRLPRRRPLGSLAPCWQPPRPHRPVAFSSARSQRRRTRECTRHPTRSVTELTRSRLNVRSEARQER